MHLSNICLSMRSACTEWRVQGRRNGEEHETLKASGGTLQADEECAM